MGTVSEQKGCEGCPVRTQFPETIFVPPLLIKDSTRLAVAECPGQTETEQLIPLVGASGSWLRGREMDPGKRSGGLYRAAGVDQSTVSLCNVINCGIAATHKNVYPTDGDYLSKEDAARAQEHCIRAHVNPILTERDWTRIDVLGDKALRALTGVQGGIQRWRGSPLPLLGENKPRAIPTLHPAFLARSQELMPAVVNDLRKHLNVPPERYNVHPTLEEVRNFTSPIFAADIECDRSTQRITMVGLSSALYTAICVPFEGAYINELRRIFEQATRVVGHNCIQFDLPILQENGVRTSHAVEVWDTMLMQHLLQPDLPHDLGFLGSFFTGKPAWKHLSGDDEALYCCRDVDVTFQCAQQLEPALKFERLWDLYQNVQVPLARICKLMQETGFRIDPSRIKKVRAELEQQAKELEGQLPESLRTRQVPIRKRQLAPAGTVSEKTGKPLKYVMTEVLEEETPWKSTQVLLKYFYEEKALPVQTHAKTGQPSVDKTCLPKLLKKADSETGRAIRALQTLRQIASLTSTFIKDEWNGIERIHAHFNVHGTASGRLSSSDPNLQNIPESARYIYVPSYADWQIYNVDFSSLENRLTAWMSHDYERLERLNQPGFNEHKWITSKFFNIPIEDVVKDNSKDAPYGRGKRINHGSNYLMGALKISKLYDIPFSEVKPLCDMWKIINAKTVAWQGEVVARAKRDGFLTTEFGRKRWFYTTSAATEAVSFGPQSVGADITFRTMLALMHERIGLAKERVEQLVPIVIPLPRPARLLAQVHDSLVIEGPINIEEEIREVLTRVMTQGWPELGGYSIPVEIGVGSSWGECK